MSARSYFYKALFLSGKGIAKQISAKQGIKKKHSLKKKHEEQCNH